MKSGNLNFLEPSGPLQACNGTAFYQLSRRLGWDVEPGECTAEINLLPLQGTEPWNVQSTAQSLHQLRYALLTTNVVTYFIVTFPCTVTANVHFFTLYVIQSAKCAVFRPYLIADMSWLCTGWVEGRWREGPRMSDRWRPGGQDSLLLGFHLRGKQLHISENILSETNVYCKMSWRNLQMSGPRKLQS
jgi:hypothetical protein